MARATDDPPSRLCSAKKKKLPKRKKIPKKEYQKEKKTAKISSRVNAHLYLIDVG
jgi:hypothetical protein